MDKISVIVPFYNAEDYLERCINSILNQTYENLELILINDGSTDNSSKIVTKYHDPRMVIINKKNTGVSDSRNKGFQKATGDIICFADADDYYEKDYLKTMYELMIANDVPVVRCNYKVIDTDDKIIDKGNIKSGEIDFYKIKNEIIPSLLDGSIPCFIYLLMIKKNYLKVKFDTNIAMMEDVAFYIDLLTKIDKMYITNKTLYTIMFNHKGATNNVKNYTRNIKHILLVNEKIKTMLKNNNLNSKNNIEKLNINHLNAIADFIFKYHLAKKDSIDFCKRIRNKQLIDVIKETDLSKINFSRRTILSKLLKKRYKSLKVYFTLRKLVYKLKRRGQ